MLKSEIRKIYLKLLRKQISLIIRTSKNNKDKVKLSITHFLNEPVNFTFEIKSNDQVQHTSEN